MTQLSQILKFDFIWIQLYLDLTIGKIRPFVWTAFWTSCFWCYW